VGNQHLKIIVSSRSLLTNMRVQLLAAVFFFVVAAFAAAPQKQALVTYPDSTPDHVIDSAKNAIIKSVGDMALAVSTLLTML
jgi:hypothetical protein